MATSIAVAKGFYRIRQCGAKSQIAIAINNAKKCFYVQIGSEQTPFPNIDEAIEFASGKGLEPDSMSLDKGRKKLVEAEPAADEPTTEEDNE